MMNNEMQAETEAQQSTTAELLPSAPLAANPMLYEGFDFVMGFGKYKDKTLVQILDESPSYIIWLAENEVIKIPSDLLAMAFNDTMAPDYEDLNNDWGCRD
jgi:uncharacterized protein (DUF3820 family)